MVSADFYKVLGTDRSAEQDDIKKAFRSLALKTHPAKSTSSDSKDMFLKIAEAYHVLSDEQRKATYDQFGMDGLKKGVPARDGFSGYGGNYSFHGNAEEVFDKFFGTKNPFTDFFALQTEPAQNFGAKFGGLHGMAQTTGAGPFPDPPVLFDLNLTLEQLYHGCLKKIKVSRKVLNNDALTTSSVEKILTIEIRAGLKTGTKIIFPREGDQGPYTIPADLVFIVKQLPHERFTRDGNNLIMTQEVSLANSLMGVAVDVVTLDGRLLKIPVNDTISPDYTKTVSAEGMPIYKTKTRGNLLIKFITKFPTVLSEKQKRLLRLALV